MQKHIPYEKLQKRKQRQAAAKRRGSWGALNPVTRKSADKKSYNRKRDRACRQDMDGLFYFFGNYYKSETIRRWL